MSNRLIVLFLSFAIVLLIFFSSLFLFDFAVSLVLRDMGSSGVRIFSSMHDRLRFGFSLAPVGVFLSAAFFYPKNGLKNINHTFFVLSSSVVGFFVCALLLRLVIPSGLAVEMVQIYQAGVISSFFAAIVFLVLKFKR